MSEKLLVECKFLIPLRRDSETSDGELHQLETWNWLEDEIYERFDGWQVAPGVYEGAWKSARTKQRIVDQSRQYVIAIAEDRIDELRELLVEACTEFCQQCIYLSIAGHVEFIEAKDHDQDSGIH